MSKPFNFNAYSLAAIEVAKSVFRAESVSIQQSLAGGFLISLCYRVEMPELTLQHDKKLSWLIDIVEPIAELWQVTREPEVLALKNHNADLGLTVREWVRRYDELKKEFETYKAAVRDSK